MSKLQTVRLSKGLSQAQLAEKAGMTKKAVQHYEQGYRDINKAAGETLKRLATALGCAIEDIMD